MTSSDHIINNASVSREHCKIYAYGESTPLSIVSLTGVPDSVKSGTEADGVILCCHVIGVNGILWNTFEIRAGSTIILLHGDTIKIRVGGKHRCWVIFLSIISFCSNIRLDFSCYLLRSPTTVHDANPDQQGSCVKVEVTLVSPLSPSILIIILSLQRLDHFLVQDHVLGEQVACPVISVAC